MKKVLILMMGVMVALGSQAQLTGWVPYASKNKYIGLAADSLMYMPVKDTNHTPQRLGALTYRSADSRVYVGISTTAGTKKWMGLLKYSELGIDSIWRVAGKDSIFYSKGGTTYKIKDSVGGATSLPLSSLTAATAGNTINNVNYAQLWQWDSKNDYGLRLTANTTSDVIQKGLLSVYLEGANATSGRSTYAIEAENRHTGTSSTNIGVNSIAMLGTTNYAVYANANNGTTAVAGYFTASLATNNYAIIVPPGGGDVGIGTTTPNGKLHVTNSSLSDGSLVYLPVASTAANSNAQTILHADLSGANSNSTQTTYAARFYNRHTGTLSTNIGLLLAANGGTNNYALLIGSGDGSVGIGTTAPAKLLHVVGTVRLASLGTASSDTSANKPLGINSSGDLIPMNYWPGSGAGGGSGITVGTTTITSGTSGRIAYNNAGVYGEKAVTGTGDVVLASSPTITSPVLGTSYTVNDGTTKWTMTTNFYGVDIASKYVRFGSSGNQYLIISTNDESSTNPALQVQTIVAGKPGLRVQLAGSQTADAIQVLNSGSNTLFDVTKDGVLDLYNFGTAPTASVTNGIRLYAEDVSASAELKVRDEAGNITTLSPHNFKYIPGGPSEKLAWSFYSEKNGEYITADMAKALRTIEQLTQRVNELEKKLQSRQGGTTKLIYKGKTKRK